MPENVAIFLLSKSKKSNIPFLFSCGSLSVYDGQNCEIDCYSRILIDEGFIYRKTFFKWYIFHKSLFVWYLSFAKRPDIRKFTRLVERFLIIFFEIIFLVAFNGNYQFVNLQKTILSPLFNICIMKAVKNVPVVCQELSCQ